MVLDKRIVLPVLLTCTLLLSLGACQDDTTTQQRENIPLDEAIIGVWEAVSFRVIVNSVQNSDSSYVFEIEERDWENRLKVKPVLRYFYKNKKFVEQFRGLDEVPYDTTRGMWNTFGDTLMMVEPNATYSYEVSIEKGLSEYYGLLDWDGDGNADDEYIGIYRLVRSSPYSEE